MKDQVLRILKMVQEGRLAPDDAYDLMDAFLCFEEREPRAESPPPPKEESRKVEEPFRRFVDNIEKMTKDAFENVNWSEVAGQVRTAARKGVTALRENVESITKGEMRFNFGGATERKTVELPLSIEAGKTLKLERQSGEVKVLGGHSEARLVSNARIRGKDKADAVDKAAAWTPVVEEHDGSVTIRQAGDSVQEDIEVYVPEGVILDIRNESGDVMVEKTRAALRFEGKSGDVNLSDLADRVEVSTSSGDITVKNAEAASIDVEVKSGDVSLANVTGNITVKTSRGDFKGKDVAGNTVSIDAVSGDIDIDLREPTNGSLNLRTVAGDILIDLAAGSNSRVSLSSLRGSVTSRVELSDERRTDERITGVLGTGEGSIDVSVVNGDIQLSLRDHQ